MDEPRDYHTTSSKSERERQMAYDITYMWNIKYDTDEHICKTKTDSQTQGADVWLPVGWEVQEGWTGGL